MKNPKVGDRVKYKIGGTEDTRIGTICRLALPYVWIEWVHGSGSGFSVALPSECKRLVKTIRFGHCTVCQSQARIFKGVCCTCAVRAAEAVREKERNADLGVDEYPSGDVYTDPIKLDMPESGFTYMGGFNSVEEKQAYREACKKASEETLKIFEERQNKTVPIIKKQRNADLEVDDPPKIGSCTLPLTHESVCLHSGVKLDPVKEPRRVWLHRGHIILGYDSTWRVFFNYSDIPDAYKNDYVEFVEVLK